MSKIYKHGFHFTPTNVFLRALLFTLIPLLICSVLEQCV